MTLTRWTRLAAVWLMGVGVLLVGAFAWGFAERLMDGFEGGFDPMDGIVVVVFSTVAGAHIAAGFGIWQGRRWGALLGFVFAVLGLLISALGLLEEWFAVLPLAGYAATLVVLVQAIRAWQPEPPAG